MKIYRKIWIEANGEIPRDHNGQSYEIHHINGDHDDNRLENLMCISIREHFEIHIRQNEPWAAQKILSRMVKSEEEYAEKCKQFSMKGENHPNYGKSHITEDGRRRIGEASSKRNAGSGNPMFNKKHTEESKKKIGDGKRGKKLGPSTDEHKKNQSKAVKIRTCPHCGLTARGSTIFRWHFDNCKQKDNKL